MRVTAEVLQSKKDQMAITARPQVEEAVVRFYQFPGEESFCGLVQLASRRLLRYFCARGAAREQAEELTQDVLVAIYKSIHSLKEVTSFWPWVYKIASNAYLQMLRQRAARLQAVPVGEVNEAQLCSPAITPWQHGTFGEWMSWFEAPERDVLILRYIEDMEYHEIAEVLQIPIGTVKWRIHQTKQKMLKRLARTRRSDAEREEVVESLFKC